MVHGGNWRVYTIGYLLLKVDIYWIWRALVLVLVTIRTNINCRITNSRNLFKRQLYCWGQT